jgi:hypothetical protein
MNTQPDLHMPGWPEMRFHGRAETDGQIWWWEERMKDGSIKRHPLMPYTALANRLANLTGEPGNKLLT